MAHLDGGKGGLNCGLGYNFQWPHFYPNVDSGAWWCIYYVIIKVLKVLKKSHLKRHLFSFLPLITEAPVSIVTRIFHHTLKSNHMTENNQWICRHFSNQVTVCFPQGADYRNIMKMLLLRVVIEDNIDNWSSELLQLMQKRQATEVRGQTVWFHNATRLFSSLGPPPNP